MNCSWAMYLNAPPDGALLDPLAEHSGKEVSLALDPLCRWECGWDCNEADAMWSVHETQIITDRGPEALKKTTVGCRSWYLSMAAVVHLPRERPATRPPNSVVISGLFLEATTRVTARMSEASSSCL
jgi:hypothetical protein